MRTRRRASQKPIIIRTNAAALQQHADAVDALFIACQNESVSQRVGAARTSSPIALRGRGARLKPGAGLS
ncbi:hypothetical protein EVAR_19764_1 [Eumeta japonica]|uniref:Uncharacterized protein n=1 Tax=Eumeta variegata TaxID=151549 RepID=A0A4C1URX2_EUMVA|nr:hypothetical protein EVAR_19764_1 [Eumeta japonica]